ncbi:serine/threonine-protein kinase fused [Toxorhynchites rutilus septentrionalis]|uniref:serine/threonine-protein kinase fused n=1 Tax=Toxorhynchites rutilus septentrionalis TaxID=329112 RepID=UPI00247A26F0|nr:serine/threonine-protein kinase fused [Toxorhynchites rutilus septentrionalis]
MEKYTISNLVGEGSFGKVYKAVDKDSKVTVALKIISKRGRSGRELKGLRGECEIQRNLQHPNIIRMLDSFETENEIIAVTEFAKTDLHSLLRDGSLGEPKTQKITYDLVSALYYLHSHRILHRDLKPQNILMDKNMTAKLCDFGFARNMTMGTHVLTSIKGTPLYMAPELLEAKPYDHHADLWSLGCIIYEMLAGEPPFSSTSMVYLVRLIRNQYIKWPSFLTANCISFVQGLLERDPLHRMPWANIINHPFVKGQIMILKEDIPESPFTNPLTASQSSEKRKQTNRIMYGEHYDHMQSGSKHPPKSAKGSNEEELSSSRDSMNVILQSDIEYGETDAEEFSAVPMLRNIIPDGEKSKMKGTEAMRVINPDDCTVEYHHHLGENARGVQDNPNLVVNHFNDNFPMVDKRGQKIITPNELANRLNSMSLQNQSLKFKCQELERRKLSQNIDNFSIRLELEKTSQSITKKSIEEPPECEKKLEKITPTLLPGWDSCDESQNPPIENEEWLVFLQKSMQEILDGELDSLKQQNFVSIIVAPLRNCRASAKVIENVAHLLSLPLAIDAPPAIFDDILDVYAELKLVPNLVYASKLLCNKKLTASNSESQSSPVVALTRSDNSIRLMSSMDNNEVKTLTAVYDLVCYLIHSRENFLKQFCDAIEILGVKELFVNFINAVRTNEDYVRLSCSVLAVLNCALRELPENAEIIEQIVFHEDVNLIEMLRHRNSVLRHRTCMLLRILARFSCLALQKHWNNEIKSSLESLLEDQNGDVKLEAKCALDEFQYLSFIAAETAF